ncbi:hypothetical protein AMEX_G25440 [Astyanax mexicanus]|uniref:Uncharacterized protein n=1 Tax=Astyanax mexicanus TaxID=7994 RepID=A0A8T2KT55_ASTMX|nr:hypothetical protein AMEX_G25440 [Astyanax mexicanus]
MVWRRFYGVYYLHHAECEVPEESSRRISPFHVDSSSSGDPTIVPPFWYQEAWTGNLTPTLHQEPSSQGSTGLPTLTFDMLGRSYRNAPPCTNTSICPLSRLDRPVLLVEEAHPLHRLDFQDTEPEFKPVPAAQDKSDLEDEDFEGQRETPETPPKTKRRWLQCLWGCFPRRRKIQPQKE